MSLFRSLILNSILSLSIATSLRDGLAGAGIASVFPGDPKYVDASAPFNLRFNLKPAAITYPTSPKDVSRILNICDALNMKAAARSGGHSYIANGLGGKDGVIVVDMGGFNDITVDSFKGTATIGSGNRLGNIALTLSKAGRAMPHGTCPYVGIGGHAAYGGVGLTSRMWGLALDTITSVNMVLANGTIITTSEHQYPDLFWGMRGSGGSFGITTSIEVRTFPEPPSATTFRYEWILDPDGITEGIEALETYAQTNIPPEINVWFGLFRGPQKGKAIFHVTGVWYGPEAKLNATIAPFLINMPEGPDVKLIPGTYIDSVKSLANGPLETRTRPDGNDTFYAKSLMTPENSPMSTRARAALAKYVANEGFESDLEWAIGFELWGGKNSAINAVPRDATAFFHRNSTFTIQFYASSPGKQPPFPNYGFVFLDNVVERIISDNPSDWDYGAYPNYVDDRLPDWQMRYYGTHYPRLQALKQKYDPKNMFNFPTTIEE